MQPWAKYVPYGSTREGSGASQASQFSTFRPRMRLNSLALAVTIVAPLAQAWAAISKSLLPIGVPPASSSERIAPYSASAGRYGIINARKFLVQRLHRFEQGDEPALAHGLDHETLTVPVHDRFIARQFELHRNTDRLIAAIAEQPDMPLFSHQYLKTYAKDMCQNASDHKR